jgi:hypothetical protein
MGVLVWAAVTLLVFAALAVVAVGLEMGETDIKRRSVRLLLTLDPSDIAYWIVCLSKFI